MQQLRPTARVPKYRLHKPSGLAVVRLGGKDIYLGKHNTAESQAEYRRVMAEWLASDRAQVLPTPAAAEPIRGLTVNELVLSYLYFAKSYYVKNGMPTGEIHNIKDAVRPLVLTHGHTQIATFGPLGLKAVRQAMIDSDLSRGVVNGRVNRIRRAFRWGVENQLVPSSVLHALQAVTPLKRGRCEVREAEPVAPVADTRVDAVLKVAPRCIATMIQLQRLTGMRPGEVVLMRTADIDTTKPVWVFTPSSHKTQHHGCTRQIHLGPQAQSELRPFLRQDSDAFIFDPRETVVERSAARRISRVTPTTPSEARRTKTQEPKRAPGARYTTGSYARAVAYACDRAFPHPTLDATQYSRLTADDRKELDKWRREHRWSPNQLRHNAATALRRQFGLDAARVVLGHSSASTTEIYAETDFSKAAEVMARVG